jgi:hypothetical protein
MQSIGKFWVRQLRSTASYLRTSMGPMRLAYRPRVAVNANMYLVLAKKLHRINNALELARTSQSLLQSAKMAQVHRLLSYSRGKCFSLNGMTTTRSKHRV